MPIPLQLIPSAGGGDVRPARVLTFVGPRQVAVSTVPLSPPGSGEVLVRTAFSGISGGTEMLAYRGELDPHQARDEVLGTLGGTFRYPFAYGYSCVGLVDGMPVFAFHPHQDRFVLPEQDLVRLPADVDLRTATLFPLVETALQMSLDAGSVQHEVVGVIGLGAVGLLTALLLQRGGARVLGSEPAQWRRDLATRLGVPASAPEEFAERARAATAGQGLPLIIEVSGSPTALAGALPLLGHEGMALVGSWYGTKSVALPLGADFHRRRLTIRSSQVSTIPARLAIRWNVARRRNVAADLLTQLPLGALATTEFAFDEAERAYQAIDRNDAGLVHVALRY